PYLYLQYAVADSSVKDSSAIGDDGSFAFKGVLQEPTMAFFSGKMESRSMDDPNQTTFFIEPTAMTLQLTAGDFKNFQLTGSKTQDEMTGLTEQKASIQEKLQPFLD